jgi:hypothetical protein
MRARVAYISSLGTTAILVTAALLMLAVVGTIVAFRGWPGAANGAGVQSVPLAPPPASARAALVISRAANGGSVVRVRPVAAVTARPRLSTAGLVKQVPGPVVAGVVMVPVHGGSLHTAAPPVGGPSTPSGNPLPGTGGQNLPPGPDYPPVDPGRQIPAPLPDPSAPPVEQVGAMVSQILGQAPPPPGLLRAAAARRR